MSRSVLHLKADVIDRVCRALVEKDVERAARIAAAEYPFVPLAKAERRYAETEMMRVFVRDGFIDRCTGQRLVFAGTLRLLSQLMPEQFPAHKNWKMSESHVVFWELFPTIDHVVPAARGVAPGSLREGARFDIGVTLSYILSHPWICPTGTNWLALSIGFLLRLA